jgi:hypothetical protein
MARAASSVQTIAPRGMPPARGLASVLNVVVLIGTPLAGAAHATLNLIGDQQSPGRLSECARLGEELLRKRAYAAFALDGFDKDSADFI